MPENIGDYEAPIIEPLEPAQAESEFAAEGPGLREKLSFLFVNTGPGPIGSYVDHPLNFSRSEGLAQIIRGLTGFLGSLEYAVVDLVIGFIRWRADNAAKIA